MALGFRLRTALFTNTSVSCWDLPERTVLEDGWISGALRHHESEQHSLQHASLRSLATCLYNRSKESNLLWHGGCGPRGGRLTDSETGAEVLRGSERWSGQMWGTVPNSVAGPNFSH